MRKKIAAALAALWACVGIVGFAACDDDTTSAPEHRWDEGTVTTAPTCMTPGVITYVCQDCGEERKELLDKNGEHHFGDYETNGTLHWRTCTLCGETEAAEHTLAAVDGKENEVCTVCGYEVPLNEYAYEITFEGEHATITVYRNDDYTAAGEQTTTAWSRDGDMGVLLKNGEGQVNFKIEVDLGYKLSEEAVTVSPKTYKNLKDPSETGAENTYRITKITGDITVTVHTEIDALDLPVMEINTENAAPIVDKENYVSCEVSVSNTGEGGYTLANASAGIRGRGNSTWAMPKKPYRIKFDEKTPLFGWSKNKSWVLLAMYNDFSNVKDYTAFNFANAIESTMFAPHTKYIELYLNGQYQGLYLLTDQTDENDGRTGVKEDFDESATQVPFLVEWDEYAYAEGVEGQDWFRIENSDSGVTSYYAIKYPEVDERYTQAQFDYIQQYIETVNSLCHDPKVSKQDFEDYVDLKSFMDYYLIQEVMAQMEINWKSIFMSKSLSGKLVMGPVWDFDWSAGGPMDLGGIREDAGWMSSTNWFAYMLNVDWFKDALLQRWKEILPKLQNALSEVKANKTTIYQSALRNAEMWDFDTTDSLMDFSEYYDWVMNYLGERMEIISGLVGYVTTE